MNFTFISALNQKKWNKSENVLPQQDWTATWKLKSCPANQVKSKL